MEESGENVNRKENDEYEVSTDEELELIQSYFCKEDELDILTTGSECLIKLQLETEHDHKKYQTELQLCLRKKEDILLVPSNPSHISLNQLHGDISRKLLEQFKNHALAHEKLLLENQEYSLFNFLIWISDEINVFSKSHWFNDNHQELEIHKNEEVYGMILKLDHIRSSSRYYKFFKDASVQCDLHINLVRYGKSIYELVFGESVSLKDYIKLHRTSLVDVDSCGKPCKERMLQVICNDKLIPKERVQQKHLDSASFIVTEVGNDEEFEKLLHDVSFSMEIL